jgi:hypothetical protein
VVCGPLPAQARWNVGVYWRILARPCESHTKKVPRTFIKMIEHNLVWRRCSLASVNLSVGVDGCQIPTFDVRNDAHISAVSVLLWGVY